MALLPVNPKVYRRAYRLYNHLFGLHDIDESRHYNYPHTECEDMVAVGAVLLQGWVSA